ncbi:DUF2207 domain-containing protein [Clavibacter zhangzhiyongii]|uniref:DUF2207 domain-containing protein n=1 Tax=Clavibacter zhangzhiyongii TaxID=2768071 RepID=UPI0039E09849
MRERAARVRLALVAALLTALAIPLGLAAPAHADVDDFSFRSFDALYRLSADADGRAVLRTTETLVAEFPDEDQNRGIRRELVEDYDGHPTGLRVISVTDGAGNPRAYESESDDGALVLTIADDDAFVRGEQTYVIDYEQRDVIRPYGDTDADEFYWDVNGLGWQQPFERVTRPWRSRRRSSTGSRAARTPPPVRPARTGPRRSRAPTRASRRAPSTSARARTSASRSASSPAPSPRATPRSSRRRGRRSRSRAPCWPWPPPSAPSCCAAAGCRTRPVAARSSRSTRRRRAWACSSPPWSRATRGARPPRSCSTSRCAARCGSSSATRRSARCRRWSWWIRRASSTPTSAASSPRSSATAGPARRWS